MELQEIAARLAALERMQAETLVQLALTRAQVQTLMKLLVQDLSRRGVCPEEQLVREVQRIAQAEHTCIHAEVQIALRGGCPPPAHPGGN